ncbi:MAG: hypothetical protein DLM66_03695 [Candidatus Dormiibacter spiritus]|nr:MAG: hypothetical protein DLM66_03695 [Candidatus Dormibacteraeota bacterium]
MTARFQDGRGPSADDQFSRLSDLAASTTEREVKLVIDSFAATYDRCEKATAAEGRGDHEEAIRFWRIVFGDESPAYR